MPVTAPLTERQPPSDPPRPPTEQKPLWRGWIHAGTTPLALASGIVLLCLARGTSAKLSCAVLLASSLVLFGNSALYHRLPWRPRMKAALRRVDHANIFLLIAGTYTPLAVLCLPTREATILLTIVWIGSGLGILFNVMWITAPRWLYVPLYMLVGWAAVMYMGDLFRASVPAMVLIVIGGVLYSIGAVVYGVKAPNPVPGVFGFHEIFHSLTVAAFACHTVAIYLLALNPPIL